MTRHLLRLPKISVVVPSLNQSNYLEATLLSILDQSYPDLELIVIDGGSTDGSSEIVRKYAKQIKFWCSEPDGGQTQGLIKGFSRTTGEIQCFLNSDDLFEPGVLLEVGQYFLKHPGVDAVYGNALWVDFEGKPIRPQKEIPFNRFIFLYTYNYIPGMSMFWRRAIYNQAGGLNPAFQLAFDADLWMRVSDCGGRIKHTARQWSRMRRYPDQKTVRMRDAFDLCDSTEDRAEHSYHMEASYRMLRFGVLQGHRKYRRPSRRHLAEITCTDSLAGRGDVIREVPWRSPHWFAARRQPRRAHEDPPFSIRMRAREGL
jgi:glycosyltransferase involved in cell wall biosynthesis